MKLLEKLNTLERLDQLIRMKATGTPKELARRLEVSERQVYNLVNDLRTMGAEISFNQCRGSYQYDAEIYFDFRLVMNKERAAKTKGGKSFFQEISLLQNFCSKSRYF